MAGPVSTTRRAETAAGPRAGSRDPGALAEAARHDPLGIGAVAAGLLLGTSALLGLPVDGPLLVVGVCGTALVYWADRVWAQAPEDAINRPERVRWARRWIGWLYAEAGLLAAGALAALPWLQPQTIGLAALLGGIALAHVAPVLPGGRRLADFGTVKPIAIGAVWALGAVAGPILEAGAPWTAGATALVVYRLAFVLANVLLADWADRRGDAAAGRRTLAAGWSRRRVRSVATVLLGGAALGAAGVAGLGAGPALLWVDAVGPALLLGGAFALHLDRPGHAALADWIVAWPVVTWAAAAILA